MELDLYQIIFLIAMAFLAGFIDSMVGGGGLISLPALLATGIDPQMALGTNKCQSSFGSFIASRNYIKHGLVSLKAVYAGILFTALGAVCGTISVQFLTNSFLKELFPIMISSVFVYTLLSPKLGKKEGNEKMSRELFYVLFGLVLGFYDGFFGPGTGAFWMMSFAVFLGFDFKKATAHTKVMNFTSNIVALSTFIFGQKVLFYLGLLMAVGNISGAYLGSKLVIRREARFVRILFIFIVSVMILKLIIDNYFLS